MGKLRPLSKTSGPAVVTGWGTINGVVLSENLCASSVLFCFVLSFVFLCFRDQTQGHAHARPVPCPMSCTANHLDVTYNAKYTMNAVQITIILDWLGNRDETKIYMFSDRCGFAAHILICSLLNPWMWNIRLQRTFFDCHSLGPFFRAEWCQS